MGRPRTHKNSNRGSSEVTDANAKPASSKSGSSKNPIVTFAIKSQQLAAGTSPSQLTTLDLRFARLSSLAGLEELTGLEELMLGKNLVRLDGVPPLPRLRCLRASYGKLSDLGAVARLPALEELYVAGNAIADLTPIASCPRLRTLEVGTKVVDLSPLASLRHLEELWVAGRLSDLSPLSKLPLSTLNLHGCGIKDISPLAAITTLKKAYLFRNRITDVSPLASVQSLTWLAIGENPIQDLSPLAFIAPENLSFR